MVNEKGKKNKIWLIIIAILFCAIVWLSISAAVDLAKEKKDREITENAVVTENETARDPAVIVKYETKEKLVEVEVEKEITHEMIQDGLNDMGVLITEEYYFTQVEDYTSSKTYLKFITSTSNFVYSYDGVVGAGINFNEIRVEKNDDAKKIIISLPKSYIQYTDIDFDSFQVYSEKEGLWNPIKISDYNDSMVEFEKNAENKAIEKGILERADEGAKTIIENFVLGLVGPAGYKVEFVNII